MCQAPPLGPWREERRGWLSWGQGGPFGIIRRAASAFPSHWLGWWAMPLASLARGSADGEEGLLYGGCFKPVVKKGRRESLTGAPGALG